MPASSATSDLFGVGSRPGGGGMTAPAMHAANTSRRSMIQLVLTLLVCSVALWFTTYEPYTEQVRSPHATDDTRGGSTFEEVVVDPASKEDAAEYDKLMAEQGVTEVTEVTAEEQGMGEIAPGMEIGSDADEAGDAQHDAQAGLEPATSDTRQRIVGPAALEGGSFRVLPDEDAAEFIRDDLEAVTDPAYAGGDQWKLDMAARLKAQVPVMARRPRPADLNTAIAPPCRPVEPAPEALVDVRPRGKRPPARHSCRKHDDHPKLAIAVSIGGRPDKPLSGAEIIKAITTVKELAKSLGGTRHAHVAELHVVLDGVWPSTAELEAMMKIMRGENDWFVVSKTRKGDARQLNKMIRMSRANHVLVLTEEDLLGASGDASRAKSIVEWAATAVGIARQADTLALIAADPEPRKNMKQLMLPALSIAHSPILIRRANVFRLGGFEEWGSCPDDPLTATVATELVIRLWRSGGSQAALLPAAAGAVNPLTEHPNRHAGDRSDAAWPFVVPGLTPGEQDEAQAQAREAKAGKWKPTPSPSVAGNCQPPDLGPQGQRPGVNEACGVTTHNYPVVTIVMQYFRRPKIIKPLMNSLLNLPFPVEFIINDDSRTEVAEFANYAKQKSDLYDWHLALSNDVHEIRGYNRLSLFASSELVYMIQDDDAAPRKPTWVSHAVALFNKYPLLGVLGGYRGRVDNGKRQIKELKQNDGDKFGAHPERDKTGATRTIPLLDKEIGVPFMWCYKVNLAPYVVRRSLFAEVGGFNTNFSCAGSPGIGLDFELSIRLWNLGWKVGLFDPGFKHAIGNSKNSGTHAGVQKKIRDANEARNNMMMYQMYPGFHHKKGSMMVVSENKYQSKRGNLANAGRRG